ncbi:hypothetical protein AAG570_009943 [Ranatra chinensis]|uniref:Uncharacterized protein n=1 Tax=Ranatra chinensis TaxID=642074 RepID=A0ABD0ZDV3_9HEMI
MGQAILFECKGTDNALISVYHRESDSVGQEMGYAERLLLETSSKDILQRRTFVVWSSGGDEWVVEEGVLQFAVVPKKGAGGVSACSVALVRLPSGLQPPHFQALTEVPLPWLHAWTTFPVSVREGALWAPVSSLSLSGPVHFAPGESLAIFVRAPDLVNPHFHFEGHLDMKLTKSS